MDAGVDMAETTARENEPIAIVQFEGKEERAHDVEFDTTQEGWSIYRLAENYTKCLLLGEPSMQTAESTDMASFITTDFRSVRGVSEVSVKKSGSDDYSVVVEMVRFDRATRRKVYAKEQSLYREFPNVRFDFDVIDASDAANG